MKYLKGRTVILILVISVCANLSFGQENKQGADLWRKITPLISTLQDAERLLGTPTKVDNRDRYYDLPTGERVTIWLSGEPDNSSCKWNVAENTVLRVIVSPRKKRLLTQAGFDLSRFEMQPTLDDEVWNYVDKEKGVLINVHDSTENSKDKLIIFIEYFPTAKDATEKCIPRNRGQAYVLTIR